MPPPPHSKPENILKRAQELIGVNQSPAALALLHEHVTSKRSRNIHVNALEPVMLLLVELAVDQKKGKLAKDALFQFKNIAQNSSIITIEQVLKKFIKLASKKVADAQQKADDVQSNLDAEAAAATSSIDDLEASETPESILLATVSGEQSRDRTDRAIVTPWLKFLWEAYRILLDILKNNTRLEILYQSTAMEAFEFCLKFSRKTEFRRLCELLRNHVQNAARYSAQVHAINLNDPDTLQRHLETRFQQLNVAVELELWQEAFRSVEDIHTLLNLSKRPPKNIMMANYYEKLTRIFLVGENYLFHATAWARYYNLLRQSAAVVAAGHGKKSENPPVTDADMQKAASFVVLSALAIPVISTTRSRGAMGDFDEARKNKHSRLTNLLGMSQAPTRATLFKDALSKSLLSWARKEIRDLYNMLEVDFHPLSICQKIGPILSQINDDDEMRKYIHPLQQVILTRLFQQLSQVYETVDLKFVESLAQFQEPLQISCSTIEKFIMNGNKKGDLSIRVNHATGVLTFDTDVFSSGKSVAHPASAAGSAESDAGPLQRLQSTPSEIVRSQLVRLSRSLFTTCSFMDSGFTEQQNRAREAALARARVGVDKERQENLARKEIIQKRKEVALRVQAQREKENAKRKLLQEQALQQAETNRLIEEQKLREQKRIANEREQIRKIELENMLKELKLGPNAIDLEGADIDSLDSNKIRMIKLQQLEREKNNIAEKLRVTWKRLDHLERAFRKEEVKKLALDYEQQKQRDLATYEQIKAQTLKDAEQKHKESVELKHRLSRLMPQYERYRQNLHERRRDEFEKRRRDAERELDKQITARKREYREQKIRERKEREEKERALREAEERAAREKEEKRLLEEAKREEAARRKAEREQRQQEAMEKAALQARREEEALARRKAEKEREKAANTATASASRFDALPDRNGPTSVAPPLRFAGAAPKPGGWRERQEAKLQATQPAPQEARLTSPSRPLVSRADDKEKPTGSGPPPLNLVGGNKPAWRERLAAKEAAARTGKK